MEGSSEGGERGGNGKETTNLTVTKTMTPQGWKLFSCSQCQELGQRANLAPNWLTKNKEPITNQDSSLTHY